MRKTYAAAGAVVSWLALGLQFYLILENRVVSVPETILRYFSFFTILTNILVALTYTAIVFDRMKKLTQPVMLTATTVYIVIVGIIYNTILRFLWEPAGLALVVDESLHTVIPLSFLVFWIGFVPKSGLRWVHAFQWLVYPAAYVLYVIVLGALTAYYPYPFADAGQLGYPRALLNGLGIIAAFYVLGLLFIGLSR